jgi:cytochrome b561
MITARIVGWGVALAMAGAIIYGFINGGFGDDASTIWSLPWGKVTLIDLYAGLALFAAWIAVRETSRIRIALWWVALVVLGNFAAGVYLVRAAMLAGDTRELLTGETA